MIGLPERCNQKTPEGGNDDATNCSSLNDAACPLRGHAGCRPGQARQPYAAQRADFARRHRNQAWHRSRPRRARQQARRSAGQVHGSRRQDQSGRSGAGSLEAHRRRQGRLRHRARRLEYAHSGVQVIRRRRHLRGRRAGGTVAIRGQGMPPERLLRLVLERRLAGGRRQIHDRHGRQERVLPRGGLSGRLRACRRRHALLQRKGHRPGLHPADSARLRARAEKPDAVFAFLVGAGGVAFVKQYAQAGLQHQLPFYTEDPVANPLTFPAQGDAALGVIMGTNWTADLDNAANKKFVASFAAKYNRLPATFAALGYDAIKLIDSAVTEVGGKIENKDAVRAALRKANFQSVRGSFKFNNNHFPIQNLYIMEVKKDENGNLKAVLKDTAIKDWQDPYHQECPMKW